MELLMIRPLIEASYDYKANCLHDNSSSSYRSNFKNSYHEACTIIGSDHLAHEMTSKSNLSLMDAITQWNNRHDELQAEQKKIPEDSSKVDYKVKMDELFCNCHAIHYLKLDEEVRKSQSKERIEEFANADNYMGYYQKSNRDYTNPTHPSYGTYHKHQPDLHYNKNNEYYAKYKNNYNDRY